MVIALEQVTRTYLRSVISHKDTKHTKCLKSMVNPLCPLVILLEQ
jgi:hypothetical protein